MDESSTHGSNFERIRQAALEGFARDGVESTSIRNVAASAGVSPGLVQHYFPSKAALRAAVDAHVADIARDALEVRSVQGDLVEDIAERLTTLVRDHFVALRYLARGVAASDEAALTIFETICDLCRSQLDAFQGAGLLRDDLDLEWAALHTLLINLATVMLEPGVSRWLGHPLLGSRQLQRWKRATTALFVAGELRPRKRGG